LIKWTSRTKETLPTPLKSCSRSGKDRFSFRFLRRKFWVKWKVLKKSKTRFITNFWRGCLTKQELSTTIIVSRPSDTEMHQFWLCSKIKQPTSLSDLSILRNILKNSKTSKATSKDSLKRILSSNKDWSRPRILPKHLSLCWSQPKLRRREDTNCWLYFRPASERGHNMKLKEIKWGTFSLTRAETNKRWPSSRRTWRLS